MPGFFLFCIFVSRIVFSLVLVLYLVLYFVMFLFLPLSVSCLCLLSCILHTIILMQKFPKLRYFHMPHSKYDKITSTVLHKSKLALHPWLVQEENIHLHCYPIPVPVAGMACQALSAVGLFLLSSTLTNVSSHLVGHSTRSVNNGLFEIDKGAKPLNAPMVCEQSFALKLVGSYSYVLGTTQYIPFKNL